MSRDIEQLLRDSAPHPLRVPPARELVARGRRRRRRRHAAAALGAAAVVTVVASSVLGLPGRSRVPEIVDRPPTVPAPSDRGMPTPSPTVIPEPTAPAAPIATASPEGEELLPSWEVAPEVAERIDGARAAVFAFGSVWAGGRTRSHEGGGQYSEIVRAGPQGRELQASIEVPAPQIEGLAASSRSLWAIRATDQGAWPRSVLIEIDPTSNAVAEVHDLGDFSPSSIAITPRDEIILGANRGGDPEVRWYADDGTLLDAVVIDGLQSTTSIAYSDGLLGIADIVGSRTLVVAEDRLRTRTRPLPEPVPMPGEWPSAVSFSSSLGQHLWVAGSGRDYLTHVNESAHVHGPVFEVPEPAALLTDDRAEGVFVVTRAGDVYWTSTGRTGEIDLVARTSQDVTTAVQAGVRLWVIGSGGVETIPLEDQGCDPPCPDETTEDPVVTEVVGSLLRFAADVADQQPVSGKGLFAEQVTLDVHPRLDGSQSAVTATTDELSALDTWQLDETLNLATFLADIRSQADHVVHGQRQPYCAGEPLDPPAGHQGQQLIMIVQGGPRGSCLQWYGVDLYVDPAGHITYIRAQLWER